MRLHSIVIILIFITTCTAVSAQSWRWAKEDLVIEGIHTLPMKTCIDSRGNTILISSKLDRQILTKHDVNGTLLWKREIFLVTQGSSNLTSICTDDRDNIYLAIGAISKIDKDTVNTKTPYSIVKLNAGGRFRWAKKIDYKPFVFAPRMVYNRNRIFFSLTIQPFLDLSYEGVTYGGFIV